MSSDEPEASIDIIYFDIFVTYFLTGKKGEDQHLLISIPILTHGVVELVPGMGSTHIVESKTWLALVALNIQSMKLYGATACATKLLCGTPVLRSWCCLTRAGLSETQKTKGQ